MCAIYCKESKKGNKYHVLVINDVYVTFDTNVIINVAKSVGISNIDIDNMNVGDVIKI